MAKNLNRLFSSLIEISKSNLGLGIVRSESFISSAPIASTRRGFVSCLSQQDQKNPKNFAEEEEKEEISAEKNPVDGNEEEEEDEDEDDGVNRQTGEIGGPKGPEPTRYGDWERNGRCSDF
ncbi:Protein of unknown function DUF1674 [Macleaya cordata]|uniref:Succinate dehydrogenase assembly factor 4, mitochondrial n=1 Tax=Macleaya cordata TaxID=56857 RepID=A0A200PUT2_MACCD|nr:Protein of unknown function DUF1674 [Macleaya cordata]